MKKKKFNLSKFFTLNWKKVFVIIIVWFVAVILHNVIYDLFLKQFDTPGIDEPFFFTIAVIIIPLYFLISVFYSLIKWLKKRK